MDRNIFIILVLIVANCNASEHSQKQSKNNHVTRTSGATWFQNPQIERSTDQSDVQDDVIDTKDHPNELKILAWVYSELKNPLSQGQQLSPNKREYSSSKLSAENKLKPQKLAKRLMGHYHRQFLSKAVDSIKNEKFNKPARLNFDLGKRSRSRSSDTEDQTDGKDKMIRKYRENESTVHGLFRSIFL